MGIFMLSSAAAATMPWAITSHRMMPPKMFTRIAFTWTTVSKITSTRRTPQVFEFRLHTRALMECIKSIYHESGHVEQIYSPFHASCQIILLSVKGDKRLFLKQTCASLQTPKKYPAWCKLPWLWCRNENRINKSKENKKSQTHPKDKANNSPAHR